MASPKVMYHILIPLLGYFQVNNPTNPNRKIVRPMAYLDFFLKLGYYFIYFSTLFYIFIFLKLGILLLKLGILGNFASNINLPLFLNKE